MFSRSRIRSVTRRVGGALLLSVLALTSACGDATTPTAAEPPETPPAPPGPVQGTLPTGRLLFQRGDHILLLGPDGPEPAVVKRNAGLPSWSPDGSVYAFVRRGNPYVAATALCVAKVDGSETRCLALDESSYFDTPPAWSPDGGSLAYSIRTGDWTGEWGYSGLHLLDVGTMTDRVITSFPVTSASWSPDGSRIALVYLDMPNSVEGRIGMTAPDGTGFRTLSGGDGRYVFREVAWSPMGAQLAFRLSDQTWNCPWWCVGVLGVASLDESSPGGGIGTLRLLNSNSHGLEGLAWSPDGTQVALARWTCAGVDGCTSAVLSFGTGGDWMTWLIPDASWPSWTR